MMKRQTGTVLAGLLVVSLGCKNSRIQARNNDGFIAGACAVGAALFAAAGIAAVVDWCSETDDQFIARVTAQYRDISSRYQDTMTYFGQISGIQKNCWDPRNWNSSGYKPFTMIPESVLHEFATHVWYKNSTQSDYRVGVWAAKGELDSSVQQLRKRIRNLEGKYLQYEDQQRLRTMRQLLSNVEELLSHISLFADALEYHKTYFNLYDAIDNIRTRYFPEISILESGRYSVEVEIKRSILSRDSSQYSFRTFVINITSDISKLESKIRALAHNYDAKRQYAYELINSLVTIKNIVVNDPRYQQELYEWEQAQLQRLQIEALNARARAERDRAWAENMRVNALHQQNRILQERNDIEERKLQAEQNNNVMVHVIVK